MPEVYFCICGDLDDGVHKLYYYCKTNEDLQGADETGRFRPYAGNYEDLFNKPFINGIELLGSEGGDHYLLQNSLVASEGIMIKNEPGKESFI